MGRSHVRADIEFTSEVGCAGRIPTAARKLRPFRHRCEFVGGPRLDHALLVDERRQSAVEQQPSQELQILELVVFQDLEAHKLRVAQAVELVFMDKA